MRKLYFLIIISLLLTSCNSCNSDNYKFSDLQRNIIEFINDDGKISQEEYNQLIDGILLSEDPKLERFKSEVTEVNYSRLNDYILEYAKTKQINLTESDIWQPNDEMPLADNFNINVFLENSGSMNGYLNDPNTQFKNSVYSLLTRLKLFADKDSLNLYLINKDNQLIFGNASNDDVEEFKNILNPASFKNISQGKTGETDINELIKRCLGKVNGNNLSVFISDCIYSPGKSRTDAAMYLAEQKQGIFLNFATELRDRNSNLSVLILQLDAGFKGTYYDKSDTKVNFNELINRPYYIWFIGTNNQIEQIIKSKKLEEIDGGYLKKWVLRIPENKQTDFKIQYSPKIGSFEAKGLPKGEIQKARLSKNNQNKGKFGFNIAVNFSEFFKDNGYLLDKDNFEVSNPDYHLKVEKIEDTNNPALRGFTHIIKLETDKIKEEDLEIKLLEKMPKWIKESSSIDDSKILTDESEQLKTFGLQYLMEGVGDAFYPSTKENIIGSFKITIKK